MELSIPGINQFEKEKLSSLSNRTNKKISLNVIEIPTFLHQIYCLPLRRNYTDHFSLEIK